MKPFALDDRAFTGLEAAMVFIAFIVVASVFAYVALGAGFFTTQRTEQTVLLGGAAGWFYRPDC